MVNLGDEVKDLVSGFQGVAVARYQYLQGCNRICVQPPVNKDGKLSETATFDEPQLEVIEAQKVARQIAIPGGPDKYPPPAKYGG